jgi:XTP/dITP diphosphohydrolase
MELFFATSNKLKVDIANEVLNKFGIHLNQHPMAFVEPQSLDVQDVATEKARQTMEVFEEKFIVDDSGLYIDALNRFPGSFLKVISKALGDEGVLKLLGEEKNRKAMFVNVLIFGDPKTNSIAIFKTECSGEIAYFARGRRKVGWAIERIFIPDGFNDTLANLSNEDWEAFWNRFKKSLHYEKFGNWAKHGFMKGVGESAGDGVENKTIS